jgi:hypothetical protein
MTSCQNTMRRTGVLDANPQHGARDTGRVMGGVQLRAPSPPRWGPGAAPERILAEALSDRCVGKGVIVSRFFWVIGSDGVASATRLQVVTGEGEGGFAHHGLPQVFRCRAQ